MKDVFLSHASPDKEQYVRPFAHELDHKNITYWLDEAEIKWGEKITSKINTGLKQSEYVVVFISKAFVGRHWPESELASALNKENSEGRTVVLPIIIGDAKPLLKEYPLLRDKFYLRWNMGVKALVSELENMIFISRAKPQISVKIFHTSHSILVKPDKIIKFLSGLDSHGIYDPKFVNAELLKCGFLVAEKKEGIQINGRNIDSVSGDIGEPGIWSYRVAQLIYELVIGKAYEAKYLGRGRNYRELLSELREKLAGKIATSSKRRK